MSTFENTVDKIGDEAFCNQIIDKTVTEVKENRVLIIGNYAFYDCSKLTTVDLPNVTSVGSYAFYDCSKLTTVDLPNVTSVGYAMLSDCSSLTTIDLPNATSIKNFGFYNCRSLTTLILRSNNICTLNARSAFDSTPISRGNGYIYVPSALVESYKTATNWSTYANQFRALEDYTVDGTTTGELDSSKI